MNRHRPVAPAAFVLGVVVVLTGCAGGGDRSGEPSVVAAAARVDVDTPALRDQRAAAGIAPCPHATADPVPGGLPDVSLPCLGGGPDVALGGLRGPLVVNLWAQWCEPCRHELPHFARLDRAGVDVLGIDFADTQPSAALALADESGVGYASVADTDGALRAPLRVAGLPTTLFVDADGRVTQVLAQEFDTYEELAAAVETHLGVRP